MKESRRARLTRRALSFVLTFSMLIALMPAYVFANDDSSDVPEQVSIEEPEAVPSFDEETETVPVIEDESEPVDVPELIPETTGEPEPEAEPEQVAEPEPGNNSKENEYLEERIEGLPFETLPARRFESSNYNFTIQPKSGYFDPGTLTYTINWKLDFNPRKIEIWGGWHIYDTITYLFWGDYEGSYTFHINVLDEYYNPSEEYVLKAYYYLGDYDAEWSYRFTVSTANLKFTSQPKTESTNLSTLKTRATWNTSFAPMKVEIEKLKEVQGPNESTWNTYEVYDTLTTYLSTNGHYDFPLEEVGETFRITAYYGADSDHLHGVSSEPFEVTSTNLGFVFQPEDGFYDPDTGNYQVTWMTNFTPVKVRVCHAEETGNMYTYTTLYSDLSDTGRCDINRNNARKLFCIAAYNNDHHCIYSKWFRINNTVPTTTGTCGKNGSELTWSYKEHILYISGNGYMADYTEDTQPWKNLRSNIKMVVLNSGVKSVGNYAFSGCLGLTVVCFPETLQSIGNYAFNRCNNLGEVRCSFPEFDADKISWDRSRNYNLLKAAWQYTVRAEGTCGDHMTWVLYGDNSLVIQGSGDMYNWSSASEVPWYKYRNDIVSVGSTFSGDVSIGQYAFAELKKLESYTILPNVSKIGEHAFEGSGLKTVKFWDDVHDDLILSDYCFRNCKSLQSFTIPKTVKKIGNYTFANCTALTEITFATGSALKSIGNAAFYECKQLNNISFPNSVTKIGSNAFYGCRSFTSLTLPSSLTSMGAYAFQNCSGITGTIEIPSGVTSIPSYAFMDCSQFSFLSFGSNVTSIGTGAFANCTNLYRVDFDGFLSQWNKITIGLRNDDLTSAHIHYLYKHGNLSSTITYTIKGGSGEVEINGYGDLADYQMPWYQYAEHIETIYISGSIKSIGAENFRGCTNVSKVYLPGSLEAVGARAFNDCKNLTDVYFDGILSDWEDISIATGNVPLTNATIHTGVVSGNVGGTDIYWSLNDEGTLTLYFDMDCSDTDMPNFRDDRQQPWYEYQDRIYRIRISEGVTYIGDEAFSCLSNLEEVEIPSSVTKMGDSCFSYCYSLDSFTFPDTVTSIGGGMFFKCDNLQTVHLPAGLTEIPVSMFSYCGTLNKVYMPSTVTSIGNYAFPGDTDFAYTGYLYYDGTSTQWSKISIGSTGNDALKTANICFIVPELAISEKNFPDANFRAYLKEKIDTDKTGWLTDAERLAVKDISCTGRSIGSLKGIAHFPNLETLNCANNLLQGELVLSENLKLTEVHCGENESLESINIEGLNKLTIFDCHGDSNLSSLDLSTNYALRKLDVSSCGLGSLDVSKNVDLTELKCFYNNLTKLDLSRNMTLFRLYCYTNHLTSLDLSHCPFLLEVDCADNDLTLLYLGELRDLRDLRAEMNAFLTLDIAECLQLRSMLSNSNTNVEYIEGMVSYTLSNSRLDVDDNVLILTNFEGIYIDEANFPDPVFREYVSENFDIDKNGRLIPLELERVTEIEYTDGDLSSLKGIEYFPLLKSLTVAFSCDLTELDLSGNPDLENLVCMACGIEELDLRANKRLTELDCNDNPLVSLNVSGLTELKYIDASYCSLTELDVSDCTLTDLFCYAGPLKSLKLGNQPNLKRLDCYYSDLSQLDISRCPLLINAWNNGTHTEKSDGVIDISLAPQVRYMAFDNDVEVTVEHDGVAITTDNFPDDVFRAYVTEEFDEDINGWLSDSEIEAVTFIEVSDMNIQSLKGIEFFVSIAGLNVSDNDLTNLDLRKNTELRYLSCRNNSLITLNLTENKKLEALESDGMKSLVAVYVSGLTHLNAIEVSDCGITVLDVSSCPLMYLACDRNPLTSLILGKQPDLDSLTCYSVELIELDISECPHLVNTWLNGEHTEYEWGLEVSLAEEGYMEIDSSLTVTLPAFVEITSQPESISGQVGEEKTMSVVAENVTSYQWQRSTDGEEWKDITTTNVNYKGAQEDTLTVKISKTTAAYRYRCVVANEYGSVPSEIATVTLIQIELQITSHPGSIFGQIGEEKTMSVVAPGATSYQWQRSTDGVNWTKISTTNSNYKNAKTDTLTIKINKTTAAYQYRCMVANDNTSVASNPASVTVMEIIIVEKPEIITQPADVTGAVGEEKTMSVVAENADSYQWQRSADGEAWSNISSTNVNYKDAKTATLTIKISKTTASYQYRCVVKNSDGSVASNPASVTIEEAAEVLRITTQPADVTGEAGEEKTMSVVAENATSYQWQRSADGEAWSNISSTNVNYKDAKTDTLTIKISKTTASYQYRCMVKNDTDSVPSDPASVTVAESVQLPVITTQPAEVTGEAGEEKTMSVVASNAASYQWQRSADGENWSNISSTNVNYKDAKTSTLTIKISKTTASYQYRCMVKNDNGSVPSEAASVTIGNVFEITVQPESITGQPGEEKTMSVEAADAVSYQWQRSADGENWSSISETNVNYSGAKTDTLTVKISKTTSSYVYRCIVKNEAGDKDISSIAEVSIATPEQ